MPLTENEPVKDGFVKLMSKEKWNTYTASLKTEYDVLQLKSKRNAEIERFVRRRFCITEPFIRVFTAYYS